MPLERVKQEFKDISMSFETNPLNDDLIALKNSSAIARSIRNIVFTQPGEKFFNPDFGSRITESLFENMDEVSALEIRDEIENSIKNFEPRVLLRNVIVESLIDSYELQIRIEYEIVGLPFPTQNIEFLLQPTRI